MSAVTSFDTGSVRAWDQPTEKMSGVVTLPQTYVAPPRLSIGLKVLDIAAGTNVRVKTSISDGDNEKFTAHADTWGGTTLYSSAIDALVLKPANLNILCSEFSTGQDHAWQKPQLETKGRIEFERPFVTPPKVLVYLKEIDAGNGSSVRVKTYVTDIDAKGFTVHINTWADTKLYSAIASWVAYPEDKDYIASGRANTMDVRAWNKPQLHNSKAIKFDFGGTAFWKDPQVFLGLNFIDIASSKNLRIKAYGSDISAEGFTWHLDSWCDTILYSAGISYIALN
ncbi:hypothetical protein B0H12DRAFT_1015479 [Mycena haematopus]|nr:hypothetical protein B0H12DRAFT_1015479 [Mycena haematopus]